MIGATEREIATVATGSGTDRISKAAVVDSLREATRPLEPQMAASVQSAALSQLQADAEGFCTREEVARVWLTNVLPALERAPPRTATGGLGTRRLTERLHRMIHGRNVPGDVDGIRLRLLDGHHFMLLDGLWWMQITEELHSDLCTSRKQLILEELKKWNMEKRALLIDHFYNTGYVQFSRQLQINMEGV